MTKQAVKAGGGESERGRHSRKRQKKKKERRRRAGTLGHEDANGLLADGRRQGELAIICALLADDEGEGLKSVVLLWPAKCRWQFVSEQEAGSSGEGGKRQVQRESRHMGIRTPMQRGKKFHMRLFGSLHSMDTRSPIMNSGARETD